MEKHKIDRINALAKKAAECGLTECEKEEQAALRAEYIRLVKNNLREALGQVYIENPDGTKTRLRQKEPPR